MILMVVMFVDGLVNGYGHALMPIAAIKLFGFTTPEWSQLVAVMGLAGAAVALAFGPLIDRFGAKHMLFLTICLVAVHAFLLAETQVLWKDALYVKVMLSIWIMLNPITMVCVIALAMALCSSVNSATQFAVYMSIGNLGISAGSKIYGLMAEETSYSEAYIVLGVLAIALVILVSIHRHRHAHDRDGRRRAAPAYTVGMGTSRAGMYWSGAMRCPKCRSDMEQIEVDGVQVDRCTTCRGLWFDPGEIELLRNRKAAAALDIGLVATGKAQNAIDHYRCPRCGGEMVRMVDPQQTHIWYEQCASCHGSYFDAGEFTDLVTVSISDFFKRFTTPERQ
jgi:Zn-finger nucleic acid-binding protein